MHAPQKLSFFPHRTSSCGLCQDQTTWLKVLKQKKIDESVEKIS